MQHAYNERNKEQQNAVRVRFSFAKHASILKMQCGRSLECSNVGQCTAGPQESKGEPYVELHIIACFHGNRVHWC